MYAICGKQLRYIFRFNSNNSILLNKQQDITPVMLHMIGAIICLQNLTYSMNLLKNKNGMIKLTSIVQKQNEKSAQSLVIVPRSKNTYCHL